MCRKFSVHDQYVVLSCPKPDREPVRRLRIEDMEFFNEKSDIIKCLFIYLITELRSEHLKSYKINSISEFRIVFCQ